MSVIKIVLFALVIIYFLLFMIFALLTGKPFKAFVINALSGSLLLVILSLLGKYLKINLAVNIYTLAVSAIWGMAGVIMQLLINILF